MARLILVALVLGLLAFDLALAAETDNPLRLKRISITDSANGGMEAYSLLAPVDWKVQPMIRWRFDRPSWPVDESFIVASPDMSEAFALLPMVAGVWDPISAQATPTGSMQTGCEFRHAPGGILAGLRQLVVPRLHPNAKAEEIEAEEYPEMAQSLSRMLPTMPNARVGVQCGRVRLQFTDNGKVMHEDLIAYLIASRNGMAEVWNISYGTFYRAPKELLASRTPLYKMMVSSMRQNRDWYCVAKRAQAIMVAGEMRKSEQILQQAMAESRRSNQELASIRQTYEQRQQVLDRTNRNFSQYIRGTADYTSGDGSSVELPSGYNQVWTTGNGEYVLSNDPLFNPNQHGNLVWTEMQQRK